MSQLALLRRPSNGVENEAEHGFEDGVGDDPDFLRVCVVNRYVQHASAG